MSYRVDRLKHLSKAMSTIGVEPLGVEPVLYEGLVVLILSGYHVDDHHLYFVPSNDMISLRYIFSHSSEIGNLRGFGMVLEPFENEAKIAWSNGDDDD